MDWLDAVLKMFVTLSGIGLAGMMVVRTNARGHIKFVGLEQGTLFEPRRATAAKVVAVAFVIGVLLAVSRSHGM